MADHLRGFFHGGPMAHCGLQNPSKPLRFKSALTGRFAGEGKAVNIEALPTNLRVRSSNLFGRASKRLMARIYSR